MTDNEGFQVGEPERIVGNGPMRPVRPFASPTAGRIRAIGRAQKRFNDLFDATRADVYHCARQLRVFFKQARPLSDPIVQFWYRALVRAFCSMSEALSFCMRQSLLEFARQAGEDLSLAEAAVLSEKTYTFAGNGIHEAPRYVKAKNSVGLGFLAHSKLTGIPLDLDLQCAGARALFQILEVRDRLVHPKSADDLKISKTDANLIRAAMLWYFDCCIQAQELIRAAVKSHRPEDVDPPGSIEPGPCDRCGAQISSQVEGPIGNGAAKLPWSQTDG